jgi:putative redox protein
MEHENVIDVTYEGGDRLRIQARTHDVLTDQPGGAGGDDTGSTPTELFVGSLVACMGFYAQRFLRRNDLDPSGLKLNARFSMSSDRPNRVGAIDVEVVLPESVPARLREPLRRVIDACTVHNSLREPPKVTVDLDNAGVR